MFKLEPLTYSFDALEPYIDAQTMELHYTKHHQGYVTNLNKALEGYPDLQQKSIEVLLSNVEKIQLDIRQAVINHGGGHYNHTLFWNMMKPQGGAIISGQLYGALVKRFESFEAFQQQFENAAKSRFGSGWAWLVVDQASGQLEIGSTANQDTPISKNKSIVLGLDVWEHAYYLQYQNRRPDYITAWWQVVNWDFAEEMYKQILGL